MRKKKKQLTVILCIALAFAIIAGAGTGYYLHAQNESLQAVVEQQAATINANQQTVYVAIKDIAVGDLIYDAETASDGHEANVEKQNIVTGLDSVSYMTSASLGSKAVVDITAGNPIMASMTADAEINADTRISEISVANLMTTQLDGDFVDVRIVYPNGEDYVVLAKKQISDLSLENCVWTTYLSEEEILRLDSAMIDAYTITGTRIYTNKYVQSNLQETAIPNYLVKPETIDLINSDPNILTVAQNTLNVQARADLENRLSKLSEDQLSAVNDGFGLTDTAKNSVLTEKQSDIEEDAAAGAETESVESEGAVNE